MFAPALITQLLTVATPVAPSQRLQLEPPRDRSAAAGHREVHLYVRHQRASCVFTIVEGGVRDRRSRRRSLVVGEFGVMYTFVSTPPNGLNFFVVPVTPPPVALAFVGRSMSAIAEPTSFVALARSPFLPRSNAVRSCVGAGGVVTPHSPLMKDMPRGNTSMVVVLMLCARNTVGMSAPSIRQSPTETLAASAVSGDTFTSEYGPY